MAIGRLWNKNDIIPMLGSLTPPLSIAMHLLTVGAAQTATVALLTIELTWVYRFWENTRDRSALSGWFLPQMLDPSGSIFDSATVLDPKSMLEQKES
jgi:hypothetical protein